MCIVYYDLIKARRIAGWLIRCNKKAVEEKLYKDLSDECLTILYKVEGFMKVNCSKCIQGIDNASH